MNFAELMRTADPLLEPRRDQVGLLDGEVAVKIRVVLDRTAVIELEGERVLIPFSRLEVDETLLKWQSKDRSAKVAYARIRSGRAGGRVMRQRAASKSA